MHLWLLATRKDGNFYGKNELKSSQSKPAEREGLVRCPLACLLKEATRTKS